jgi:hypothetical protein
MTLRIWIACASLFVWGAALPATKGTHGGRAFERKTLTTEYYCEGANFGDLDRNGVADVVSGPYWYEGPDYVRKHEIYPPVPQDRKKYADNFFSFVADFDRDGWNDVLVIGFPGTPAAWYRNPGRDGLDRPWVKTVAFDEVSNESPTFTNIVGDPRPELVCARGGHYGYAAVDWDHPERPWTFHSVSGDVGARKFAHGLGVGDVNGDGRADLLVRDAWFEQPASLEGDPVWRRHQFLFAEPGGAQMHVYDVDGDGDADVITSLNAHGYGLAWWEQVREGSEITFKQHTVLSGKGEPPPPHGVSFSELHSVALADMDGDGLKDIVTGKTYWSHHDKEEGWNDGAVVYWFKLVRSGGGADFVPQRADDDSGIGRQVVAGDLNRDGLLDLVTGNMKGTFVLMQKKTR